jgi:hypothetical protein
VSPFIYRCEHWAWVMVPNYHPVLHLFLYSWQSSDVCIHCLGSLSLWTHQIGSQFTRMHNQRSSLISPTFLCSSVWVSGLVCSFIVSVNPSGTRAWTTTQMLDTTLKTRLTSGLLKSRCIIWAVQLVCHVNVRHCSCVHVLVIIISTPVHFIEFNFIFWNYFGIM